MKIPAFRSMACVVFGSLLGVLAATVDVPAALSASLISPPTDSDSNGPPIVMPCRSLNARCCNPSIIKEHQPPEAPGAPIVDEEGDLD